MVSGVERCSTSTPFVLLTRFFLCRSPLRVSVAHVRRPHSDEDQVSFARTAQRQCKCATQGGNSTMKFHLDRNSVDAVSWPSPMPWRWSQIACTEVLEKVWITDLIFLLSHCCWLGFRSRCTYTVHQKFMQLAPPCAWLRELQRCRTSMWSLLRAVARMDIT